MKTFKVISILIIGMFFLNGCGSSSSTTTTTTGDITTTGDTTGTVILSGTMTYDLVHPNSNNIGLDYDNITKESIKDATVEAINASNQTIALSKTDSSGNYSLSLPTNTVVKIRVSAKMYLIGTPQWSVVVVDNTNNNALYTAEGSLVSTGTANSQRDLNAPSGWDGTSYSSPRVAAPFAIMDSVRSSMQKVLSADASTVFPELVVNWSAKNIAVSGDETVGQITTSHYTGGNLYILGDANSDTDEYDDHVISHEWGHYYEDKISRSDSIGGSHGGGDRLDIRVAFSEGFGNAFSAMALENPIYFDTSGAAQSSGFNFDIESEVPDTPGWYSEASVQRILYDFYDDDSDGLDTIAMGFAPLHSVFTGAYKSSKAFTSIFTFVTALKSSNSTLLSDIDAILSSESIASITDVYGTSRTNLPSQEPYSTLIVGGTHNICTTTLYGTYNKLGNRKYVRFTIASTGNYTVRVAQSGGSTTTNPNFVLYKTSPFALESTAESSIAGVETKILPLSSGGYLMDISEYNNIANPCFDVTVTAI